MAGAFASHIALSGLMALFPFLIFATTLASFLGTKEFADTAVHVIFDMWPSNIAAPIANEVMNVLTVQRSGLLTLSVIAAAYFASNGVEALRIALNRAYRVTDQRSIIFCRLQSLGFVLVGTLSLMAISFLLVLAPLAVRLAEQWFPDIAPFTGTIAFWRYTVAVGVLVLALFMVHIWLPAGRRSLGDILPGILITLIAACCRNGLCKISGNFRHLCDDLCGPRLHHGGDRLSLYAVSNFHHRCGNKRCDHDFSQARTTTRAYRRKVVSATPSVVTTIPAIWIADSVSPKIR